MKNDKPFRKKFHDDDDHARNERGHDKPFRKKFRDDDDHARNEHGHDKPFRKKFHDDDDHARNEHGHDRPFRKKFRDDGDHARNEHGHDKPYRKKFHDDDDRARNEHGHDRPFRKKSHESANQRVNKSTTKYSRHPRTEIFDEESFDERYASKVNRDKAEKGVRLNKYIAHAGICSRREADTLIAAGSIKVNGNVVTEMGYKVMPGDVVNYGGETLRDEAKRYFLLNKPKGFITTLDDPQERKTVMMLIDGACPERIYPVGRLDRATTGLLLFTNDGDLAKKLTHPSSRIYKVYQVEVDKPVTRDDMQKMLDGIELEDGMIQVDDVQYVENADDKRIVGVQLHSGKNRIVRRIFESLGYEIHKLDRVVFAGLTKKDLPRGRYRELTEKEISFLRMI